MNLPVSDGIGHSLNDSSLPLSMCSECYTLEVSIKNSDWFNSEWVNIQVNKSEWSKLVVIMLTIIKSSLHANLSKFNWCS